MDIKKVFEALPHVQTIWVTGDQFHLHPHNGGKEIHRGDLANEVKETLTKEVKKPEIKPIRKNKK
jgi:hypothetical protein